MTKEIDLGFPIWVFFDGALFLSTFTAYEIYLQTEGLAARAALALTAFLLAITLNHIGMTQEKFVKGNWSDKE